MLAAVLEPTKFFRASLGLEIRWTYEANDESGVLCIGRPFPLKLVFFPAASSACVSAAASSSAFFAAAKEEGQEEEGLRVLKVSSL